MPYLLKSSVRKNSSHPHWTFEKFTNFKDSKWMPKNCLIGWIYQSPVSSNWDLQLVTKTPLGLWLIQNSYFRVTTNHANSTDDAPCKTVYIFYYIIFAWIHVEKKENYSTVQNILTAILIETDILPYALVYCICLSSDSKPWTSGFRWEYIVLIADLVFFAAAFQKFFYLETRPRKRHYCFANLSFYGSILV